ncbi:MAG: phytanoyl-CoA dioxygenase family protein, partial [Pseudomonadota bacterium]
MTVLTEQEVAAYADDGYVIPSFRLKDDRVRALRDTLDRLIRENPGVRPEKLVSAHIEGRNDEGVKGSRDFLDLAHDPEIVRAVSQLIGDDVILWGCHIFCKPGGSGFETPWHQDGHYWPIRPLATCTVWIALDRSDRENGCLKVIPRSHADCLHA